MSGALETTAEGTYSLVGNKIRIHKAALPPILVSGTRSAYSRLETRIHEKLLLGREHPQKPRET